jgi:hypothetical protein
LLQSAARHSVVPPSQVTGQGGVLQLKVHFAPPLHLHSFPAQLALVQTVAPPSHNTSHGAFAQPKSHFAPVVHEHLPSAHLPLQIAPFPEQVGSQGGLGQVNAQAQPFSQLHFPAQASLQHCPEPQVAHDDKQPPPPAPPVAALVDALGDATAVPPTPAVEVAAIPPLPIVTPAAPPPPTPVVGPELDDPTALEPEPLPKPTVKSWPHAASEIATSQTTPNKEVRGIQPGYHRLGVRSQASP